MSRQAVAKHLAILTEANLVAAQGADGLSVANLQTTIFGFAQLGGDFAFLQRGADAQAVTILLSWLFAHTVFAVHYAHEYVNDREQNRPPGLDFPAGLREVPTPQKMRFGFTRQIIETPDSAQALKLPRA